MYMYYCLQIVDFAHFTGIIRILLFDWGRSFDRVQFMCVFNFALLCRYAKH